MSTDLILANTQLPAHLRDASADALNDSLVTSGPSFPRLSLRGGKFRLRDGGDEKTLKLDEMSVIIVAATPLGNVPAKVFYKGGYVPGEDAGPDCRSSDGIRPDAGVESPQSATTCAVCPKNAWGSAKTEAGKDSKACKDTKALYLVTLGKDGNVVDKVVQLRVPTMSLRHMSKYAAELRTHKIPINGALTKLSFSEDTEYPELKFGFGGFLDKDQYDQVMEIAAGDVISEIMRGEVPIAEEDARTPVDDAEEEAPKPTPKKKVAKKKASPKETASLFEEEDDEEEAPKPTPKKKAAKKPEPEVEEEVEDDFDAELESLLDDLED